MKEIFVRRVSGFLSLLLCLALTGNSAGCGSGSDGPALHTVSGTVTFDGEPVEDGRITFRTDEGKGKAYSGDIKDGSYKFQSEAGKMSVQIIASRDVPGKFGEPASPDEEPPPVREMYIPEKYNEQTTLTAEVTAGGENKFPFDLESEE